ncbi:5' nucleotidase, NT5C type [Tunicatimonas pelagia]|uniref:5' nucleotidase, NT5C type n=1 Tax=Tunicatimonas pelagia TaxID=931531 RepID=UPI002665E459|nr:5'(3')-deoxyribonucleotidase [Tunicatimonas pelagia]WKN42638.1 5'(3')-deoxyribonucleotidase [Tunicatimonas pelagia]
MKKKRVAIDMDEVMADALGKLIRLYEDEYQLPVDQDELVGHYLDEVVHPDHRSAIRRYLFTEDFFEDLDVMPGSQDVVRQMHERYEIFIVTAAMEFPGSLRPKYRWLQQHFSFIPWSHYVFCGDKSIIQADFLIDDHAKNLVNFSGEPLLFSSPHNANETRFTRLNNWQEVSQYFLSDQ